MKQSDGNTVNVSKKVNEELEKIKAEYPDLNIDTIFDQADYINLSINNLKRTAMTASCFGSNNTVNILKKL